MKALIICGDHIRHRFILEPIIKEFSVIKCIVMKRESEIKGKKTIVNNKHEKKLLKKHFKIRFDEERKNFGKKTIFQIVKKKDILKINPKSLNSGKVITFINKFNPNICFLMGPNIIKKNLLNKLPNKTFNIHLGLSPWYRGSATLFWPSYNMEPWKTGVTFHKINDNADAGPIIHQSICKMKKGMRLVDLSISAMKEAQKDLYKIIKLLKNKSKIKSYKQKFYGKSYIGKSFRAVHLKIIYDLFNDNIVDYFLSKNNKEKIPKFKIIKL